MEREPGSIAMLQTDSPASSPAHSAGASRGGYRFPESMSMSTAMSMSMSSTAPMPSKHLPSKHFPPILTFADALAGGFSNPLATPDPSTPSTTCTGSSSQSQVGLGPGSGTGAGPGQGPHAIPKASLSTSVGSLMPLTSVGELVPLQPAEALETLAERRLLLKRDVGDGAEMKPASDAAAEPQLPFSMPISR